MHEASDGPGLGPSASDTCVQPRAFISGGIHVPYSDTMFAVRFFRMRVRMKHLLSIFPFPVTRRPTARHCRRCVTTARTRARSGRIPERLLEVPTKLKRGKVEIEKQKVKHHKLVEQLFYISRNPTLVIILALKRN